MTDKKKPNNIKSIRPDIVIEEEVREVDPVVLNALEKVTEQVNLGNIRELVIVGVGDDGQTFRCIVGASKSPFLLASLLTTAQTQLNEERIFPFTAPELYEFLED